MQYTV